MAFITIDQRQARVLFETPDEIEVRDEQGNRLGYVARGFSAAEIAEARRILASNGPWYTTQQVLDHLRSLKTQ